MGCTVPLSTEPRRCHYGAPPLHAWLGRIVQNIYFLKYLSNFLPCKLLLAILFPVPNYLIGRCLGVLMCATRLDDIVYMVTKMKLIRIGNSMPTNGSGCCLLYRTDPDICHTPNHTEQNQILVTKNELFS